MNNERDIAMNTQPDAEDLGVELEVDTNPMSALVDDMRIYFNRCIDEELKNASEGIEDAERAATALRFARRFMMQRYEQRLQCKGRLTLDEDVERHVR